MIENKILKKNKFPAKIALGEALFPTLVQAKNQLQNLKKTPESKKMHNKTFKCYKLLLFFKKIKVNMTL